MVASFCKLFNCFYFLLYISKLQKNYTKYKEKYPKIKIINQKINKGVSNSRNLGIKSSIGEYIIFIDSDDYLEKFSLYKLSKFIENNKKAVRAIERELGKDRGGYVGEISKKHNIEKDVFGKKSSFIKVVIIVTTAFLSAHIQTEGYTGDRLEELSAGLSTESMAFFTRFSSAHESSVGVAVTITGSPSSKLRVTSLAN